MPKTILVHIGCTGPFIATRRPPEWIQHCIRQYFTWNDGDLYILTDTENLPYLPKHNNLYTFPIEEYASDKISRFAELYNYPKNNFWTVTALRLIYLENFLRVNDFKCIYHFENDVLVYFNIAECHSLFQSLYKHIAITSAGPELTTTGFMYIDSYTDLEHLTDFFIATLNQLGIQGTRSRYKVNLVSEMSLTMAYEQEYTQERMAYLPTIPFGEQALNFDAFKSIFDPSGWGHFVAGSRQGEPPGFRAPWTYIGQMLEQPKNEDYKVIFKDRCPYFSYDGKLAKINNLHIHTKNLEDFLSS